MSATTTTTTSPSVPTAADLPIWRIAWRAAQHEPRSFWVGWLAFVVFFSIPALTGFLLARGFEALSDGDTAGVYRCAIAVFVAEVARMGSIHIGAVVVDQVVGAHADAAARPTC